MMEMGVCNEWIIAFASDDRKSNLGDIWREQKWLYIYAGTTIGVWVREWAALSNRKAYILKKAVIKYWQGTV